MMNAVSTVPSNVRDKIKGVVLFGYTKNAQKRGGIPNYPKNRVRVFCAKSDGVCGGTLLVTAGHFAYMGNGLCRRSFASDRLTGLGDGPKAIAFLVSQLRG
jgi:cutinase